MLLLTPSVSGLFKWRQFEPEVILLAVGWYLRFSLWKNSLPSADFRSTTSPSGGGCSVTPQKFSADCERGSDRPTTVGGRRAQYGLCHFFWRSRLKRYTFRIVLPKLLRQ